MGKKDSTERGHVEIRTYALLAEASRHALEQARSSEYGRLMSCLHAVVSSAFAVEAYLNHVGPSLFRSWESLDRLSVQGKLELVCEKLEIPVKYGERPFQGFRQALKARNLAAHGRTQNLRYKERVEWRQRSTEHVPVSTLESFCELPLAESIFEDMKAIIELIDKGGLNDGVMVWSPQIGAYIRSPDS